MIDYCDHICSCSLTHERDCTNVLCYDAANATKEKPVTSDPDSWIQASAKTLADTLSSKNNDYAPGGEFSNFEEAAEFANNLTAFDVMLTQMGIKVTRIKTLAGGVMPQNESMADSLLDLAGYAIIAHAYVTANNHTIEPEEPFSGPKLTYGQLWNPAG